MTLAQLQLVNALAFVLLACGILLRARRLPSARFSRNASGAAVVCLFNAALMTGSNLWGQHLIDESAAFARQHGFPSHAPPPAGIWELRITGFLLVMMAGFFVIQLALTLLQNRRGMRNASASPDA